MTMNPDFIQLKTIDGELKLSLKTSDYGVTVSTKELVFHKPHVNYHMKLEDIVSLVPFASDGRRTRVSVENPGLGAVELASGQPNPDQYRMYVKSAVLHNRSGITGLGAMQFVIPIHPKMLKLIAEYSGLHTPFEQ
jgi:hypothetical protein